MLAEKLRLGDGRVRYLLWYSYVGLFDTNK